MKLCIHIPLIVSATQYLYRNSESEIFTGKLSVLAAKHFLCRNMGRFSESLMFVSSKFLR